VRRETSTVDARAVICLLTDPGRQRVVEARAVYADALYQLVPHCLAGAALADLATVSRALLTPTTACPALTAVPAA
jgi:hypothetical protein